MNNRGKSYVTEVNKRFNNYKKTMLASNNKWIVPHWNWTSPPVQERLMRLGIEVLLFEIAVWDVEELEMVAVATVKEDYLNRHETNNTVP
jgi:hypothetical protein